MQNLYQIPQGLENLQIFHIGGAFVAQFSGEELLTSNQPWQTSLASGIYLAVLKIRNTNRLQTFKFIVR